MVLVLCSVYCVLFIVCYVLCTVYCVRCTVYDGAQKEEVGAKCGVQQMLVVLCPAEVMGQWLFWGVVQRPICNGHG